MPELFFGEKFPFLQRRFAGIDRHIGFEVENALEFAQRHVEQMADAARQTFEEPHVRAGAGKLDVAEAFAADFRQCDFNAALVANDAAMLHALVLAAQAFPVGNRSEDARAEQAVALRLECAVVDGFRFSHFTV